MWEGDAIFMTISIFVLKFKSYPNFLNVSNKHNSSETTVPKRVPVGNFLTLWVSIGSLFIFQSPYFHCFG